MLLPAVASHCLHEQLYPRIHVRLGCSKKATFCSQQGRRSVEGLLLMAAPQAVNIHRNLFSYLAKNGHIQGY